MSISANKPLDKANVGAELVIKDVIASRPAAAYAGRIFYASDTGNVYRDNGTTWDLIAPIPNATPESHALGMTHGQLLNFGALEELTTIAAAATSTSTIQIPAGGIVLAVSTLVTVAPTTAVTMTVGDGTTAAKFNTGSNIPTTLNATDPGTKAGPVYYAAATSIVYTPNATPATAVGRVRTTIFYYTITVATS